MTTKIKSFDEFKIALLKDQELQKLFKADPLTAIQQFEQMDPIYTQDKWIYRIVVGLLGLIILIIVVGVIILTEAEHSSEIDKLVPTMLTATCSAALGAMTGLLAPSPRGNH